MNSLFCWVTEKTKKYKKKCRHGCDDSKVLEPAKHQSSKQKIKQTYSNLWQKRSNSSDELSAASDGPSQQTCFAQLSRRWSCWHTSSEGAALDFIHSTFGILCKCWPQGTQESSLLIFKIVVWQNISNSRSPYWHFSHHFSRSGMNFQA